MNKNHPVPHVLLACGLGAWAGPLLLERLPSCIDTRPAGRMGTREEEDFGLTPNGRDQAWAIFFLRIRAICTRYWANITKRTRYTIFLKSAIFDKKIFESWPYILRFSQHSRLKRHKSILLEQKALKLPPIPKCFVRPTKTDVFFFTLFSILSGIFLSKYRTKYHNIALIYDIYIADIWYSPNDARYNIWAIISLNPDPEPQGLR